VAGKALSRCCDNNGVLEEKSCVRRGGKGRRPRRGKGSDRPKQVVQDGSLGGGKEVLYKVLSGRVAPLRRGTTPKLNTSGA